MSDSEKARPEGIMVGQRMIREYQKCKGEIIARSVSVKGRGTRKELERDGWDQGRIMISTVQRQIR